MDDTYPALLARQRLDASRRVVEGLPMFAPESPQTAYPPPKARQADPDTSHAAAASVAHQAAHVRGLVLGHLAAAGVEGRTADEIEQAEGWRAMTAARRLSELWEAGAVARGPDTRATQSGRQALVYRVPSCVRP